MSTKAKKTIGFSNQNETKARLVPNINHEKRKTRIRT
jgi:hypothetical protein